ncbi:hypothetical protein GCM10007111_13590 [Virgibacillus kapii]|uniref:Uncharacterized protein n=1 Tax=Virgibacillus kapii TaxID=1638645 RepID=A0ABQ2DBW1_9BACI|nr:hypothetical protein GCM10007111_13590 [Virgibacillus kapii]
MIISTSKQEFAPWSALLFSLAFEAKGKIYIYLALQTFNVQYKPVIVILSY